jgi:hypothetical protein
LSGDRPNSTVHLVRGGSTGGGGGGGARQEATAAISKLVESQATEKRARKAIADGAEYHIKVAKLEYTEKCQDRLDRITDDLAAGEVNGNAASCSSNARPISRRKSNAPRQMMSDEAIQLA